MSVLKVELISIVLLLGMAEQMFCYIFMRWHTCPDVNRNTIFWMDVTELRFCHRVFKLCFTCNVSTEIIDATININ